MRDYAANTQFIELLRGYRESRRLSQSRLARLLEVDHSYVSRIEAGARLPSKDLTIRMAQVLELDPAQAAEFYFTAHWHEDQALQPNTQYLIAEIIKRYAQVDISTELVNMMLGLMDLSTGNRNTYQTVGKPFPQ